MDQFSSTPSASNSAATSDATDAINTADEFEALYKAYLTTDDTAARESMYNLLVTALDGQCVRNQRSSDTGVDNKATLAAECEQMVRLPKQLVLPHSGSSGAASTPVTAACPPNQSCAGDECSNQFESLVRSRFPANEEVVLKQLRFQDALLAMQRVLEDVQIPFFLACGTALGARRDGCFIPHDEDIDLGILYADISKPTAPHSSSSSPLAAAQDAVYQLLHSLAASGVFLTFDVCGAVDKGLEVRALHTPSNTRIDLNVYYPPVPGSDDELVRTGGPFLWASSFYEAAAARRHGMYRYRHKPFETELVTVPFCAKTVGDSGFRIPPERYLEENYGAGWRVPKQYSYTEGLTNEFKNIIEE